LNWLTIVLATLIVLAVITGYSRGLVAMLVGIFGYVIALFVAGRYAVVMRDWLQRTWLATDWVIHLLKGHLPLPPESFQVPASALSYERVLQLLQAFPAPASFKEAIARSFTAGSAPDVSLGDFMLRKIAEGMLEAACFVVIAAIITWVLIFIARASGLMLNKLPIVGFVNRGAGAVIGLVEAGVTFSVVLGLLAPFLSTQSLAGLQVAVANSTLAQWLIALYPVLSRELFGHAWLFLGL